MVPAITNKNAMETFFCSGKVVRNLLKSCPSVVKQNFSSHTRIIEGGKLEPPKSDTYKTGQLFLHRIFAYRGVILFPWIAKVYNFDISSHHRESLLDADDDDKYEGKEISGIKRPFYQALIDSRDCPYIRTQTEVVTFLRNQDGSRSLYKIPGMDYVSQEDILPYNSTDKNPIHHELFDKFLIFMQPKNGEPSYVAQDTLKVWQKKNLDWLELSDVHKETTDNIRITIIPFYLGTIDNQLSVAYWWRYCIRMENLSDKTVQLKEQHWRIFSPSGTLETVRDRGVVGHEPILSPSTPAFQYSNHVSLEAPSGHMWGTFRMEREDGFIFDCRIPLFPLKSKSDDEDPQEPTFATE